MLEDDVRLSQHPIFNLCFLKVEVKFFVFHVVESHFFDHFGQIHSICRNSVLLRNVGEFDIIRRLANKYKKEAETKNLNLKKCWV